MLVGGVDEDDGGQIAELYEGVSEFDGIAMAAAPELLQSLIAMIEAAENPGLDDGSVLAEARRVAARAQGS